jgi:hypothetical protein
MIRNLSLDVAVVLGLAAGANGLFMLAFPMDWYFSVSGVTTTGPFNQHFIRDIGLIFLFMATAFLLGGARPKYRVILWAAPTLWLAGHALFHFWEVAVGICEPSVLARDFQAVTLPTIVGAVLTPWAVRDAHDPWVASALLPTLGHVHETGADDAVLVWHLSHGTEGRPF